ncbi:SET and MYND domain-containing protein 5 [Plakobranchus ocellatus]|uniref:Protein-lysine N-trimethyltransferase SMYD5 n=1 Tax=Plakobranchus ocellatus TaxID=259542 RepID=A0AAV4BP28_9GAST|nr:SET and MYND domain-containing protein 5 [Plakobranchus ocellatus]
MSVRHPKTTQATTPSTKYERAWDSGLWYHGGNRQRGPPKEMLPKLKKGDKTVMALTDGTLNYIRFMDRKEVRILTTEYSANTVLTGKTNPGKGLVARKAFKRGDAILEEKPLVCAQFSWNELYKYTACEFCLRSLENAEEMAKRLANNQSLVLPYPECCDVDPSKFSLCPQCQVLYCSPWCREAALSCYHEVLCLGPLREDPDHPLNQLINQWRSFHYPPETGSIMLIVKIIAMIKQAKDKGAMISKFSTFVNAVVNEQENTAHKLLGKQFLEQREILRNMLREVFFEESVEEWYTPEGFNSLFALIGTNGQGIGSSSFSRWVKATERLQLGDAEKQQLEDTIEKVYDVLEEVSGAFLDCEGSGLYQLQSAANHSCVPNAEITFQHGDHTLTLVALENIGPEEEITISYLGCCDQERGRHSRQKALRENYLFTCGCDKCLSQADDASITSEDDIEEEEEEEDEEF